MLQSGTCCTKQLYNFRNKTVRDVLVPGAALTYFNDGKKGGGGGGGSPSDFLGSEILAESDCFGSMKDAVIYLGRKKEQRDFLGCKKRTKGFFGINKF